MAGVYRSNKPAVMSRIVGRLAQGIDVGLDAMQAVAVQEAPVGKRAAEQHGTSKKTKQDRLDTIMDNFAPTRTRFAALDPDATKPTPVMVRAPGVRKSRRVPSATTAAMREVYPVVNLRAYLETKRDSGRAAAKRVGRRGGFDTTRGAGSFTWNFQSRRTGKNVSNVGISRRGTLTAKSLPRGGYLKAHIHRTQLVIDGNRVRGSLRSDAPYSAPVEFGYRGAGRKGTSSGPGKSFMRPAMKEFEARWRDYFKG